MAIFLSYELGFSARFSSAKLHKFVDICKKNRNYFIDNQLFILNFSIDYFNKKSSTAVPSRNAQSPQEQIVRSEAKIRKGRRIFEISK